MPLLRDRVRETTTTVGTGTITLGGAVTGYQSFNTAFTNGDTTYYVIQGGTEWEIGIGTIGAGTLARTTVLQSSNADALVPFAAGTKDVFCSYVADRAVTTSDAATLTNKTLDDYTNNIGANSTHFRIKATGTISKGQVVKATGFTPGENAIEVAVVTSATDLALGIAESALTTGQFGLAVVIGELFDVNTNGLSVGAIIYSNGTGGYTTTKPSSGTYQPLGWVVRANLNNGVIAVNIVAPLYVETSTNTANTAVLRDGSGNFAAGTLTLAGLSVDSPTLVVDAANNRVGFGTVTPAATVHSVVADGGYAFAGSGTTKGFRFETNATETRLVGVDSTLGASFQPLSIGGSYVVVRTNGTTEAVRIDASGNVGIGTASPGGRLHVTASGVNSIFDSGAAADGRIELRYNGVRQGLIGFDSGIVNIRADLSSVLRLGAGNADRWSISTAGHFLAITDASFDIGASGANRPRDLYLSGNSFFAGYAQSLTRGVNGGFRLPDWYIYNSTSGNALLIEQGSNFVRINSDGNVGLNITPSAWGSTYRSVQTRTTGFYDEFGTLGGVAFNAFYNGTNWIYNGAGGNATAQRYEQGSPGHRWFSAATGAGGATISWGNPTMHLDFAGNLGLGITPGTWGADTKAIQMAGSTFSAFAANLRFLGLSNATWDGTNFRYINTAPALQYRMSAGTGAHEWSTAPSGTAGTAVTFTQAMTLDANGNFQIGTTTSGSYRLAVTADSAIAIPGALYTDTNVSNARQYSVYVSSQALWFRDVTAGVNRWVINSSGHLLAGVDASYDIGASGANRPRNVFVSGTVTAGNQTASATAGTIQLRGPTSTVMEAAIRPNAGSNGWLTFTESTVADRWAIGIATGSDALRFVSGTYAGTERMRIDASGNLLVGKTTASVGTNGAQFLTTGFSGVSASNTTAFFLNRNGSDGTVMEFGRESDSRVTFGVTSQSLTIGTGGSERMRLDASGNLGLGVTPSAWSTGKAVEVGQNGTALWSVSSVDAYLTQGAYFNTSFRYSHTGAGGVSAYQQASGTHKWYIAAGGTAGNTISFTQAMTLDASGNLLVGTATTSSASSVRSVLARAGSSYLQLTNTTSTGTGALVGIGSTGAIEFYTHTGTVGSEAYTQRWNISSSGHLLAATDASFDIGASGANRPRDLFLSRNLTVGGQISAVQTANVKFATMWPSSIQGLQIYGDCGPSGAHLRMTYPSVADWDVLVLSSGDLTIRPNNTERIRFTVAGNVGIGVNPSYNLDVSTTAANPARFAGTSTATNTALTAEVGLIVRNLSTTNNNFGSITNRDANMNANAQICFVNVNHTDTGAIAFTTRAGADTAERMRVKQNGQVRFLPLTADPANAEDGDVYYNSSTNKLRVRAGGAWVDLH